MIRIRYSARGELVVVEIPDSADLGPLLDRCSRAIFPGGESAEDAAAWQRAIAISRAGIAAREATAKAGPEPAPAIESSVSRNFKHAEDR